MEYLLLLVGMLAGGLAGYLLGSRKSAALKAQADACREREALLERNAMERLAAQEAAFDKSRAEQQKMWEERLRQQREEAEALHRRMGMEFENLSNRIFQSKAEDFSKLNAERLDSMLRPLGENLKDFSRKVEQAYASEARERFSLGQRIKELVELNNRLSEDANNLTRALKGDSKMQGNWGEVILERLLQASGLIEGQHYVRQEFLKDEDGSPLTNEDSGKKMQPDIIIRYPGEREMIIDSKVSLTAYTAYTAAERKEEQARWLKAHLQSVRTHIDELSAKDYSRYDAKAPDFVMMFIPTEGAYLLAIQSDATLWEYAYNKKVVLMSPTNLISALRLSLDLWKRESQVKNVEAIIRRGTALYERVADFTNTYLNIGKRISALQQEYDDALNQLSEGRQSVVNQAERLRGMSLTPKKRISSRLTRDDSGQDAPDDFPSSDGAGA